jgi:hypothetical protein
VWLVKSPSSDDNKPSLEVVVANFKIKGNNYEIITQLFSNEKNKNTARK